MQVFQKVLACRCFQSTGSWFLARCVCCLLHADAAAQPRSAGSGGRKDSAVSPTCPALCTSLRVGRREPACSVFGSRRAGRCSSPWEATALQVVSSAGEVGSWVWLGVKPHSSGAVLSSLWLSTWLLASPAQFRACLLHRNL